MTTTTLPPDRTRVTHSTNALYAPAGGDWTLPYVLAIIVNAFYLGLIVWALTTKYDATGLIVVLLTVTTPATILLLAWDTVTKTLRQVTRDGASMLRFVSWRKRTTLAAPRRISPLPGALATIAAAVAPFHATKVALIPTHPDHATQILAGERPVLIRRTKIRPDTEYVLLYVTRPVKRVVAIARIADIDTARPEWLAAMYGPHMDLTAVEFDTYAEDHDHMTAITLAAVHAFPSPLTLDALALDRAPQTYRYLTDDHRAALRATVIGTPTSKETHMSDELILHTAEEVVALPAMSVFRDANGWLVDVMTKPRNSRKKFRKDGWDVGVETITLPVTVLWQPTTNQPST